MDRRLTLAALLLASCWGGSDTPATSTPAHQLPFVDGGDDTGDADDSGWADTGPPEDAARVGPGSGDTGASAASAASAARSTDTDSDLSAITAAVLTPSAERRAAYEAREPKSVLDLQMFRERHRATPEGSEGPEAWLVDLNPVVHEWFLVELTGTDGRTATYHLENHDPARVRVAAAPDYADGLLLEVEGQLLACPLWSEDAPDRLAEAVRSEAAYVPLCDYHLSLRNAVEGRRSNLEATAEFLRDSVWGGEQVTSFVKQTVYQDSDLLTSEVVDGPATAYDVGGPAPFQADPASSGQRLRPKNVGLPVQGVQQGTLEIGRWYPVEDFEGVWFSTTQAQHVDPELVADWGDGVRPLDEVERDALIYMTAFDLDQHEVRFDTGTDHPRVGWSSRARHADRGGLPGPDGFDEVTPLRRNGQVNPGQADRLVATFTGGFKRSHGAFRSGKRAHRDSGSHYGFVEHGVVESKLIPGLVTIVGWTDGSVEVVMWTEEHEERLAQVRWARQNGVPLMVTDPETGEPRPGGLVTRWGPGNWSGSVKGKLRSVRSSLCIQETERGRYLLHGYFSSATPSAMARVLAAYGCETAMVTDMNALEHTYLSLHRLDGGIYDVFHLIQGMRVLDEEEGEVYLSRFVGLPDNRDFFTILREEQP